jgi:sugar lactone lactonase YvrE
MANGVARAADGTIFASNDFGTHIERVDPAGSVERRWARLRSANGLAIDPSGRYLYAAQTFTRPAIARIELADPANVTTHAAPKLPAGAALLDGLAIDTAGRLYVAANGAGQIWQVDTDRTICALARGLKFPSAVALGRLQRRQPLRRHLQRRHRRPPQRDALTHKRDSADYAGGSYEGLAAHCSSPHSSTWKGVQVAATAISPKVTAASLGAAIATSCGSWWGL